MNRIQSTTVLVRLFLLLSAIPGCDQGLSPETPPQYGIAGTVLCTNWPPPDSVRILALAAFKHAPSGNLFQSAVNALDSGTVKFVFLSFTYGDSTIPYQLLLAPIPPGTFQYVGIGQFFGPGLQDLGDTNYWRVAGSYPGSVVVPANDILKGVDISVDLRNPSLLP